MFVDGRWLHVSILNVEAISANGRYTAMKEIPQRAEFVARRFVVKVNSFDGQ
jgi:hypothetical protein